MRGLQNKIKMICKTLKDLKSVLRGCLRKKRLLGTKKMCARGLQKKDFQKVG